MKRNSENIKSMRLYIRYKGIVVPEFIAYGEIRKLISRNSMVWNESKRPPEAIMTTKTRTDIMPYTAIIKFSSLIMGTKYNNIKGELKQYKV